MPPKATLTVVVQSQDVPLFSPPPSFRAGREPPTLPHQLPGGAGSCPGSCPVQLRELGSPPCPTPQPLRTKSEPHNHLLPPWCWAVPPPQHAVPSRSPPWRYLQARSPRALVTLHSLPVGFSPMLPTTASRTYCLRTGHTGRCSGEVPQPQKRPRSASHITPGTQSRRLRAMSSAPNLSPHLPPGAARSFCPFRASPPQPYRPHRASIDPTDSPIDSVDPQEPPPAPPPGVEQPPLATLFLKMFNSQHLVGFRTRTGQICPRSPARRARGLSARVPTARAGLCPPLGTAAKPPGSQLTYLPHFMHSSTNMFPWSSASLSLQEKWQR